MKIRSVLKLYDRLLEGSTVMRGAFCKENAISERTFYRYICELQTYLNERRPGGVIVVCPSGGYRIRES